MPLANTAYPQDALRPAAGGTKKRLLRLALAGNPNCGKTTLFNVLTGSNQYVGNWPGVTVAKKAGRTKSGRSELVDLPGIYSLSPYSMEEVVARDYIQNDAPDAIINIIDGANLERNLYLTIQLLELGRPLVVAVNMMDDLQKKGWKLDCSILSEELGVPVVPITARRGENVDSLLDTVEACAAHRMERTGKSHGQTGKIPPLGKTGDGPKNTGLSENSPRCMPYEAATRQVLDKIGLILEENHYPMNFPLEFFAAKLLEGDREAAKRLHLSPEQAERIEQLACSYENGNEYGDRETLLADARYRFIEAVAKKCLKKGKAAQKLTLSDRIDRVVTSRLLAIPIFLLMMFTMFALTFGPVGKFFSDAVGILFSDILRPLVQSGLAAASAPAWCSGLILDAVIGGVSGVLVFLPQIALLFLCLTLLEDSGYMARAAFIMDRLLRRLGLSGKSFIPMLMGFGCSTPAIMAARTLENEKDRRMTMMLVPFMSCGARLPIYAMFAGVFFPSCQGLVVFAMYLLGIVVAIVVGVALKHTLFQGDTAPFVMELPPYRMPLLSSVFLHVWEKCKGFLVKAGTILLSMSVLIWLLENFSPSFQIAANPAESILGRVGAWIAPVLRPLGFGTWQAAVALLTGLIAKESVVSTLTILYAGGNAAMLPAALSAAFDPVSASAFLVFSLLYMPCISAFVTLRREMNSWKWAFGTAALSTGVAWLCAMLVYRLGRIFFGGAPAAAVSVPVPFYPVAEGGNPAVALLCAALVAIAVLLFLRGVVRAVHGRCCGGCSDCRMRGSCQARTGRSKQKDA